MLCRGRQPWHPLQGMHCVREEFVYWLAWCFGPWAYSLRENNTVTDCISLMNSYKWYLNYVTCLGEGLQAVPRDTETLNFVLSHGKLIPDKGPSLEGQWAEVMDHQELATLTAVKLSYQQCYWREHHTDPETKLNGRVYPIGLNFLVLAPELSDFFPNGASCWNELSAFPLNLIWSNSTG